MDARIAGDQHIDLAGHVHSLGVQGGADHPAEERPQTLVHPRHVGGNDDLMLWHHQLTSRLSVRPMSQSTDTSQKSAILINVS